MWGYEAPYPTKYNDIMNGNKRKSYHNRGSKLRGLLNKICTFETYLTLVIIVLTSILRLQELLVYSTITFESLGFSNRFSDKKLNKLFSFFFLISNDSYKKDRIQGVLKLGTLMLLYTT